MEHDELYHQPKRQHNSDTEDVYSKSPKRKDSDRMEIADVYYPTYRVFSDNRLQLAAGEQIDFKLSILIDRPLVFQIAVEEDLYIDGFTVVTYEASVGSEKWFLVATPLFLW